MFNEFAEGPGGAIPDLTAPSKAALIHLLRNEDKWPSGFEFTFQQCSKCAMGLAQAVWPKAIRAPYSDVVSDAIGIPRGEGNRIFMNGDGMCVADISAEDVAKMLESV